MWLLRFLDKIIYKSLSFILSFFSDSTLDLIEKNLFLKKKSSTYFDMFILLQKNSFKLFQLFFVLLKWKFIKNISTQQNIFVKNKNFFFLYGIFDFLKKFKIVILIFLFSFLFLIFLIYLHLVTLNKIIFLWFLVFLNIYWILSTFVFFIKKYNWGRFTTANQRFWKRSLLLIWIIEFFLFGIFFYLTHNANSESFYMLDQLQIYKNFLSPINFFLVNLSLVTCIIIFLYLCLLNLKWQNFNKLTLVFLIISNILGFILFFECYQFYHLINYYCNIIWEYDIDSEIWSLEFESRKSRTYHHYSILLAILRFWHIIFIIITWFFFFLRALEIGRFRYISVAASLQNFLFLYVFNWIFLFPWLKFFIKYYSMYSYTDLFVHFRFFASYQLFIDFYIFIEYFLFFDFFSFQFFFNSVYDYFYWSFYFY
jgi:hypothetical protein